VAGPTPKAFKAQLVIPEQRQLYDYWLSKKRQDCLPHRADISPSDFPRLLPFVSLIDCEIESGRFRVRLAGTRLREVYDCEITGRYVDEFDPGTRQDYWLKAYRRLVSTALPAQGVVRGPQDSKDHLVQFWLRLPLAGHNGDVGMILAIDSFVPALELPDHKAVPV
jgi:hypothetical protein